MKPHQLGRGVTTFTLLGAHLIGMALSVALVAGCAAGVYKQGERAARTGDWDAAVEYYRRALQEDPRRADYRIAFERAKLRASWVHLAAGRDFEARDDLAAALREYRKASEYDPSNDQAIDRLATIEREIRDRIEATRAQPRTDATREQAGVETQPPLLNPASREPLRIQFTDASLRDILDFVGSATGINVIYDQQFQDRPYSVHLDGVTIEEALDLILTANQYFYKVLSQRAIMITPDTAPRAEAPAASRLGAAGTAASVESPASPEVPTPTTEQSRLNAEVIVTSPGSEFRVGGGPYTVAISIVGASRVSALTLSLSFSPTVLRVRSVQEGSFMRQGGANTTFLEQAEGTTGRIDVTLARTADATGASGSGLLAAIVFEAIGPGSTTLTTSGVAITPGGGQLALQISPVAITVR